MPNISDRALSMPLSDSFSLKSDDVLRREYNLSGFVFVVLSFHLNSVNFEGLYEFFMQYINNLVSLMNNEKF